MKYRSFKMTQAQYLAAVKRSPLRWTPSETQAETPWHPLPVTPPCSCPRCKWVKGGRMSYVTYFRWNNAGKPWPSVLIKPQETLRDVAEAFRRVPGATLDPEAFFVQSSVNGWTVPMQHILDEHPRER